MKRRSDTTTVSRKTHPVRKKRAKSNDDPFELVERVLMKHDVAIDELNFPVVVCLVGMSLSVATYPQPIERQEASFLKEFGERARRKAKLLKELLDVYEEERVRCEDIMRSELPLSASWYMWPDYIGLHNAGRNLSNTLDDLRFLLEMNEELVAMKRPRKLSGKPTSFNVAAEKVVGILGDHGVKRMKAARIAAEVLECYAGKELSEERLEKVARRIHASINDNRGTRRIAREAASSNTTALLAHLKSPARTSQE